MGTYVSVFDTPGEPPLWGGGRPGIEPPGRNLAGIDGNRCNGNDCCVWDRYATGL